jgi:hypothetical protein
MPDGVEATAKNGNLTLTGTVSYGADRWTSPCTSGTPWTATHRSPTTYPYPSRGGHGLRLDHCGPTLDQAVSQEARRRLFRKPSASRKPATSASAMTASVITAATTSLVRAEARVPSPRPRPGPHGRP